jgi:hypothetical protein
MISVGYDLSAEWVSEWCVVLGRRFLTGYSSNCRFIRKGGLHVASVVSFWTAGFFIERGELNSKIVYISGLDFLVWLNICTIRIYKWCVVLGTRLSVGMQVTHVGGCSLTRLWASGWQVCIESAGSKGWSEFLVGLACLRGSEWRVVLGAQGGLLFCRVYIERGGLVCNFRSEVGGTQSQPPNSAAPAFSRSSLRRVASSGEQPTLWNGKTSSQLTYEICPVPCHVAWSASHTGHCSPLVKKPSDLLAFRSQPNSLTLATKLSLWSRAAQSWQGS